MRRLTLVAAWALAAAGLPACALNQEGVPPPKDDIFFPAGALADDSGDFLYVANSNSDLRYNNGTLVVVKLAEARADYAKSWPVCPNVNYIRPVNPPANTPLCCWDFLDHQVLNCESRQYVDPDASVRIGSFAAGMVFKADDNACENGGTQPCSGRLFVAVRGNSSITMVDTTNADGTPKLSCSNGGPGSFGECDDKHRLIQRPAPDGVDGNPIALPDAEKILLPEEPYALAMNKTKETPADKVLVGHLRGGAVSLIDLTVSPPSLVGFYGAIIPADSNGLRGITSLIFRDHGVNAGHFYAGSRYVPRVMGVVTTGSFDKKNGGAMVLDNIAVLDSGEQYVSNLSGSETRGIQFIDPIVDPADTVPKKDLAFVLQRVPPALLSFDSDNMNNTAPVDVLETCNSPTFLYQHGQDQNLRLYVNCFEDGEVYVFDPRVPRLVDIIEVGRGPAGMAFADQGVDTGKRAYVVGFGANNISVVDIEPGSATENHVIQRLGYPSPVPR